MPCTLIAHAERVITETVKSCLRLKIIKPKTHHVECEGRVSKSFEVQKVSIWHLFYRPHLIGLNRVKLSDSP